MATTPLSRSATMARIRGKDTSPELSIRRHLRKAGVYYRVNHRITGIAKPDIVIPKVKLAIFIDGCFWHGCPIHGVKPKTNVIFWDKKLRGNQERDARQTNALRAQGWNALRFWEHDVESDPHKVVSEIITLITKLRESQE